MLDETQVYQPSHRLTESRRCTAISASGASCRAWAVRGSDPPRCAPHGGGLARVGAPSRNQNARTHGFYARDSDEGFPRDASKIDAIISDLERKQELISRYIDDHVDDLSPTELARFLSIHAQSCTRLGRLLRDREILTGGWGAEMNAIVTQALAELDEEWGTDLSEPVH